MNHNSGSIKTRGIGIWGRVLRNLSTGPRAPPRQAATATPGLCSSALSPEGVRVAASDAGGTRLFEIDVKELQVRDRRAPVRVRGVRTTPVRGRGGCAVGLVLDQMGIMGS